MERRLDEGKAASPIGCHGCLANGSLCRLSFGNGRQLEQLHPGFDLLVPPACPEVDHQAVGTPVLAVSGAAFWALRGAFRFNGLAGFLEIVHIKPDVVHALHC
jgi:hypothetical protein